MSDHFDEEPDGDPHGECVLEINRLKAECERFRADAERKRNLLISIKTFLKHTYPDAETKGVWVEPLRLIDAAIDAVRGKP